MSDVYSTRFDSAGEFSARAIPEAATRAAGAAVFVGLVLGMGVWSYQLGTRDAAEVPVIRAMEGPVRIQPADPGGLEAAHQGLAVNAVLAGVPAPQDAAAMVTPPPPSLADEDRAQAELVPPAPEFHRVALESGATGAFGAPAEERLDPHGEAAAFGAEPISPGEEVSMLIAEVLADGEAEPVPASLEEAPRPRSRPAGLRGTRAVAPAAPAVSPDPAAAREVASLASGARLVQLGAFDSEAIAREAWGNLVARHHDLLGEKSLYIERTTANARVFYRLRVAGFEGTDQTRAMCEALRARSVDCIPVTLQ